MLKRSDLFDHQLESSFICAVADLSLTDVKRASAILFKSKVTANDFKLPLHSAVIDLGKGLLSNGQAMDIGLVKQGLKNITFSDEDLTKLLMGNGNYPTESTILGQASIIRSLSARRRALELLVDAEKKILDLSSEPSSTIAELISSLATASGTSDRISSLLDHVGKVEQHIDQVQSGGLQAIIPSGIADLDIVIGGLQPTLTVVGALPGVGKSAFFATIIQSLCSRGIKCGVFSLEDDPSWMVYRILSDESGVDQFLLRNRKLTPDQLISSRLGFDVIRGYSKNAMVVDGSDSDLSISDIVSQATDMIVNHGVRAIFVDHIGEISPKSEDGHIRDRYDLVVSRQLSLLRGIANKYGVPVVVASHLVRRDGLSPEDTPKLTDFANSSGAERKARVAIGLSRRQGSDTMRIHILKNTNGKSGLDVEVTFKGSAAMIKTIEGDAWDNS